MHGIEEVDLYGEEGTALDNMWDSAVKIFNAVACVSLDPLRRESILTSNQRYSRRLLITSL